MRITSHNIVAFSTPHHATNLSCIQFHFTPDTLCPLAHVYSTQFGIHVYNPAPANAAPSPCLVVTLPLVQCRPCTNWPVCTRRLPFSGTGNQPLTTTRDGFPTPASSVTLDSRRAQGIYCSHQTGDKEGNDGSEQSKAPKVNDSTQESG